MIKYLKSELKHIPVMILIFAMLYGMVVLATNYLFNSSEVQYDNTTSGINSDNVQDAIDELYADANNYAAYNTRLTTIETNFLNKHIL